MSFDQRQKNIRQRTYLRLLSAVPERLSEGLAVLEISLLNGIARLEICSVNAREAAAARIRISAALKQSGFRWPGRRISVRLSALEGGGELPYSKALDLPIALGILRLTAQVDLPEKLAAVGALGLDGRVETFDAARGCAYFLAQNDCTLIFPETLHNSDFPLPHAALYIRKLAQLRETSFGSLNRKGVTRNENKTLAFQAPGISRPLVRLKGQELAWRGLLIAAAGWHKLCFVGAAGSGKSELLAHLPQLFPLQEQADWEHQFRLHCQAGLEAEFLSSGASAHLHCLRPGFSRKALFGDGSMPGALQLAGGAVLLFEEISAFSGKNLNWLQELIDLETERERFTALRIRQFPLLAAAANPCRCGYLLEPELSCSCTPQQQRDWSTRFRRSLRERFDLWVPLHSPAAEDSRRCITSADYVDLESLKLVVQTAWGRQRERQHWISGRDGICFNAQCEAGELAQLFGLENSALAFAQAIAERRNLSLRSYRKFIALARTIADLADAEVPTKSHLAEAAQYLPQSCEPSSFSRKDFEYTRQEAKSP